MSSRSSAPNACPWCAKTSSGVRAAMILPFAGLDPPILHLPTGSRKSAVGPGARALAMLAYVLTKEDREA